MTMPKLQNIKLDKSDFAGCDWHTVIDGCDQKECINYYKPFFEKANAAQKSGNAKNQEIFTLLGAISQLFLKVNHPDVFHPLFAFENMRGFLLDDISEEHIAALSEIAPMVKDAEMRARIADVVWVKGRSKYFPMVEIAVKSYIESAQFLLNLKDTALGPQYPETDRFERALNLAALDKKHGLMDHVLDTIQQAITKHDPSDTEFPFIPLIRLLLPRHNHIKVDISTYSNLCKALAEQFEKANDWFRACTYWMLKADWHRAEKNTKAQQDAQLRSVEANIKIAKLYVNQEEPAYPPAIFQLQQAIEKMRRIGGMQQRCHELHSQIIQYQQARVESFQEASFPFDVGDLVKKFGKNKQTSHSTKCYSKSRFAQNRPM
jgi:hypothetical protein